MSRPNPTPAVSCRYGAPHGRPRVGTLKTDANPLYLARVRLDAGGYDAGGSYWGLGQPLFHVADQAGNSHFLRAADRDDAKAKIREAHPGARFFR